MNEAVKFFGSNATPGIYKNVQAIRVIKLIPYIDFSSSVKLLSFILNQ